MNRKLIIGTRGSDLALWQANYIKDQLNAVGVEAGLKIIKTQGDIVQTLRLDKLEGKGFFTKELEEELLAGSIDLAVHSHKDLPTQNPPGLMIAAVSEREDPAELLIVLKDCTDFKKRLSLKHNATVGTSSNRRKAQMLAMRPDLTLDDLRGNVITRIEKLRDEKYDAIMLAKAGVLRLNIDLSEFYVEELPPTEIIPAPAQGVLAVQIRENDAELFQLLQQVNNKEVSDLIAVERKVLSLFDGGCHAPIGCYCRKNGKEYEVWTVKSEEEEEFPDRLYLRSKTLDGIAEKVVAKYDKQRKFPLSVFITRDVPESSYFARSMAKHSIRIEGRSLIRIFPIINRLDPFILKHVDWVFFASKNGIENFFRLNPKLPKKVKFAVIGRGSEETLRNFGYVPDFNGEGSGINLDQIGAAFSKIAAGKTVLLPRAKGSLETIQKQFTADTKLINLPVYETRMEEHVEKSSADVLIFTSPSNVEAYFVDNLVEPQQKVICIGHSTASKLSEYGLTGALPYSPDEIGLSEAVFGLDF
ncbi:hydroxymethylbilane synthase [bacterium A37T11]|nr:hydroxymethylbilane synthase [bacterium A37T11]